MQGAGQELFNVSILLIAVLMLSWHNVWMARHGREMAAHMKAVGEAVAAGKRSLAALSIVVGIAVLREGAEIVLFLYGIAISGNDTAATMAVGGAFGLLLGGVGGALMYFGLLRIPARHPFKVTSWLIALLAAGMATQAMAFLQQAEVVTTPARPHNPRRSRFPVLSGSAGTVRSPTPCRFLRRTGLLEFRSNHSGT
jgi:high-affinity iron transporter